MSTEEWMSASSRVFARLFRLEMMAQDSGMTAPERTEHAALTTEGIALFRDPAAGRLHARPGLEPGRPPRPI